MRNFNKFLALLLAVLMMAGMVVTVSANVAFTDVSATDDYAMEINHLADIGILDITSELPTFNSTDKVQRYRMAVWLAAMESGITAVETWADETNTTVYTDLNRYQSAISYVTSAGIMGGRTSTEFAPNDYITLAETSRALVRLLGYESYVNYDMSAGPDAWKWAFVKEAKTLGIIDLSTFKGNYNPEYQITRGDAAYLLMNALYTEKRAGGTLALDVFGLSADAYPETDSVMLIATETAAIWGSTTTAGFVKFAVKNADGTFETPIVVNIDEIDMFEDMTLDEINGYLGGYFKIIAGAEGVSFSSCGIVSVISTVTSGVSVTAGNNLVIGGIVYGVNGVAGTNQVAIYESGVGSVTVNATGSVAQYKRSVRCRFDDNGEPVWFNGYHRARGIYYGADTNGDGIRELVADYIGGRYYLNANDEVVIEIVPDINSVGYYGVLMAGQWGKEQAGNVAVYRYATAEDWANVALITDTSEEVSNYVPADYENLTAKLSLPENEVNYEFTTFDDDGDGIIDRIYVRELVSFEIAEIEEESFNDYEFSTMENFDGSAVTAQPGDYALARVQNGTLIIKELYPLLFGQFDEEATSFQGHEYTTVDDETYNTTPYINLDTDDFVTGVIINNVFYIVEIYNIKFDQVNVEGEPGTADFTRTFVQDEFTAVVDVNDAIEGGKLLNTDFVRGVVINNRFTAGNDTLYVLEHYPIWTGIYKDDGETKSFDIISKTSNSDTQLAAYVNRTFETVAGYEGVLEKEPQNGDLVNAIIYNDMLVVFECTTPCVDCLVVYEVEEGFVVTFGEEGEEVEFFANLTDPYHSLASVGSGDYFYAGVLSHFRGYDFIFEEQTLFILEAYDFTVAEYTEDEDGKYFGGVEITGELLEAFDGEFEEEEIKHGDYVNGFIDRDGNLWIREVYELQLGNIAIVEGVVYFESYACSSVDYLEGLAPVGDGDIALAVFENGNLHVKDVYKFSYGEFHVETVDDVTTNKFGDVAVNNIGYANLQLEVEDGDYIYATVITYLNNYLYIRSIYKYEVGIYVEDPADEQAHGYKDIYEGELIASSNNLTNNSGTTVADGDYVLALKYNDDGNEGIIIKKVYPVKNGEILGYENIAEDTAKVIIKDDDNGEHTYTWIVSAKTSLLVDANTVALRTDLATRYIAYVEAEGVIVKISERLTETDLNNGLAGSVSVTGNAAVLRIIKLDGTPVDVTISDVLRNIYRYPTNNVFNYQSGVVTASNLAYDKLEATGHIDSTSLKWAGVSTVRGTDYYIRAISMPTSVIPLDLGHYDYTVSGEGLVAILALTDFQLLIFTATGEESYAATTGVFGIEGLALNTKIYVYTPVENGSNPYFKVAEYTVADFVADDTHEIAGHVKAVTMFKYGDALVIIGEGVVLHSTGVQSLRVAVIPADTQWNLRYQIVDGHIYAVYTTQTDIYEYQTEVNIGKVKQIYEVDTYGAVPASLIWDTTHELYNVTLDTNEVVSKYLPDPTP